MELAELQYLLCSLAQLRLIQLKKILGYLPAQYIPLRNSSQLSSSSPSEGGQDQSDEPIEMDNPFQKEQKQCILCEMDIVPNYKNVQLLSQFQSSYTGRIYGKHITGLCKNKQLQVETEIRKAQALGLMATYLKSPEYLADPKLFDPERPLRPHKY